ncbi:hypothetical protein NMG60_11014604, partial [Bertholletia excelsa]
MATTHPNYHFTRAFLLYLLLLASISTPISAQNVTSLLSSDPDLSDFTSLLISTDVAGDLNLRSSLTLLAVPNSFLKSSSDLTHRSPINLSDVIRYHVLLEYLSWSDLRQIPAAGKLVTTLYQTTGRAAGDFGSVNITRDAVTGAVTIRPPSAEFSTSNATVLALIKTLPYNVSIFSVNSLIIPNGDEGGAGITLFVPTDDAFANLPASANFQSLPADKKAVVLKFHVLHSYYPLGSLESIVNPVQPTLATELMGAGSFTLNISRVNGSVAINSGMVQASVTQTVFDQKPVVIFGISRVLLPKEIFGKNPILSDVGAPPPEVFLSPENSPAGMEGPPSHLSSPPGFREEIRSGG